ncbi:MAG TPA: glycosyltransferase family A protein [Rariglobus sp.]|jgi:hypothetical protein|nr:glycosyltransferase family A protein [Rariglobus sp.]
MPTIRVFLLTCRRPHLLPRALASLRTQTFTDWVCELHNDAPDDDFPRRLLEETADPRITLHQHKENWGPVATFNHACSGSAEPFFSILEDDNWWQPTFLARLHAALLTNPESDLIWSNLCFWREEADGSWTDMHRTLWPEISSPLVKIALPQLIQFDGPLHSNGSMLVRSSAAESGRLLVPSSLPFSAMENMRERVFRSPWLLITEPLANFALTRTTSRGTNLAGWMGQQTLMATEFLRHVPLSAEDSNRLWQSRRDARPRATSLLFFAGILTFSPRFLSHAKIGDWIAFFAGIGRRPRLALAAFRASRSNPELARTWSDATRHLGTHSSASATECVPPLRLAVPEDLRRIAK